ncbi:MAG: RagB/SusD family nutrient uptake outer membrane protein [Prevotella sp.]
MKTTKYIIMMCTIALLATSCDDWLDVRGENISKEDDQFENYKGFRDALTGCYIAMADADAYGQRLTMTDIEYLADLWYVEDGHKTYAPEKYYLSNHDYSNDYSRPEIKAAYAKLFNVVASANVLLKNIESKGGNINDNATRKVIEGEAYAIRAYCQLDILRLFGQLPKGGTKQVRLPYSYTTNIDERPAFYSYSEYVELLKKDIEKAESLLKDNDPIFSMTYTELNAPSDAEDDFLYYRQSRLNYWAVRALHARMALYIGDTGEANSIAREIISAKGADGEALISLSGISDLSNGYNALPTECLFYLSKFDVNDYANDVLTGGRTAQVTNTKCYVSNDMLTQLYASVPGSMASHNRYLYQWNRTSRDAFASVCPVTKKYWYDENTVSSKHLVDKNQIIPMLRLSEIYLIAIETCSNLAEAQALYDAYMRECQFTLYDPFESLDAMKKEIINEYRREFYAEGQMFYCYKRNASKNIMFLNKEMQEEDYILPLPSTEIEN